MVRVIDFWRLFLSDCKIKLARSMEFRFDFITGFIFTFVGSFFGCFFHFLIYSNTHGYPGWNFDQVILFQAVLILVHGIRETLFGNVRNTFETSVQYGGVDRLLLYPFPSLGVFLVKGFQFNSLPLILAGFLTLLYAINKLNLSLNWWNFVLFIIFITVGLVLYISFIVFYCALAIRWIFIDKLKEVFDQITQFSCYPVEIFSGITKTVYLTIIPVAVFIYFPSQALLGRLNIVCIYSLIVSFLMFFISIKTWNYQLKQYSSMGG